MKKLSTLLFISFAFILGLTQCKKSIDTITSAGPVGEPVYITLNVGDGGKHIVYPGTGAVVYTENDKIYVGNKGLYIGTLTYHDGAFSGTIYGPSTEDYLHFYFLGNLATGDITEGSTTSFTVNIADQSSSLPVLSYGHSSTKYIDGNTTYGCTLLNQCALAEFKLNYGNSGAVKVTDMPTVATISFANPDNAIAATGTKGVITLNSQSETSKWAILLPVADATATTVTIGGTNFDVTVPAITANTYLAGSSAVAVDNIDYVFTVNGSGKTVHFSHGNLQYTKSTSTWSFMTNQYDIAEVGNVGDDYANQDVVGLFLWGANGENGIAPYNTSNSDNSYWKGSELGSNDWAIKANAANLDGHDDWFILSKEEWNYLISNHTHGWSTVAGHEGYVFRPDGNNTAVASSYTKETWADEEAAGSVFLPAAGSRLLDDVFYAGECGCYWTSTSGEGINAWGMDFDKSPMNEITIQVCEDMRNGGHAVRLVR